MKVSRGYCGRCNQHVELEINHEGCYCPGCDEYRSFEQEERESALPNYLLLVRLKKEGATVYGIFDDPIDSEIEEAKEICKKHNIEIPE